IRDHDLLLAVVEAVEAAVGVFFEHRKISQVVLVAVGAQVAEDAQARLLVGKNESAEIAGEGLNTGAGGDEIVVRTEVRQFHFDKGFLQSNVCIQPRGALANVDVHDSVLLRVQVIDVDLGRELDLPVDGTEGGVAVKQVDGERQVFAHEVLPEAAEELGAVGAG